MPTCRSKEDFAGSPFIYIHTPKTGGVSLTAALTEISEPYESDLGLRSSILDRSHDLLGRFQGILFWHITMHDLLEYYGEDAIRGYYSFSFIRNPWDWLVSMYLFILRTREHPESMICGHMSFPQFLRYWQAKNVQQLDFTGRADGGGRISSRVSRLYRFEDFPNAVADISDQLGIALDVPVMNNASERDDWRSYYDRQSFELVRSVLRDDIAAGNYEIEY